MERFFERLRQLEPLLNICILLSTFLGIFLAYRIGEQQNEINARAVQLENFVELFVYPGQGNLNVVNVGTRPIYLKDFTLNGKKESMGGGALPNVGDHWYAIPLPAQASSTLDLVIDFEDYQGQPYQSSHHGTYQANGWKIESSKSMPIGK